MGKASWIVASPDKPASSVGNTRAPVDTRALVDTWAPVGTLAFC